MEFNREVSGFSSSSFSVLTPEAFSQFNGIPFHGFRFVKGKDDVTRVLEGKSEAGLY
jgi:hypothetical protein